MLGSAGSIMSIASGFSAMMDAMMTTNSGKPIGRWPEETQALALISDTYDLSSDCNFTSYAAMHNAHSGMAARQQGGVWDRVLKTEAHGRAMRAARSLLAG